MTEMGHMIRYLALMFLLFALVSCTSAHQQAGESIVPHRVLLHGVQETIHCPGYRQPAKLMRDRNSHFISRDLHTAKSASVGHLGNLPVPANITGHSPRQPGAETHIWRVIARVAFAHLESDGDAHIGLIGPHGKSMVAEVTSPLCLNPTNRFYHRLVEARSEAVILFGPSLTAHPHDLWIQVIGPLFFDELGHGEGHASNGAEVHSVFKLAPISVVG